MCVCVCFSSFVASWLAWYLIEEPSSLSENNSSVYSCMMRLEAARKSAFRHVKSSWSGCNGDKKCGGRRAQIRNVRGACPSRPLRSWLHAFLDAEIPSSLFIIIKWSELLILGHSSSSWFHFVCFHLFTFWNEDPTCRFLYCHWQMECVCVRERKKMQHINELSSKLTVAPWPLFCGAGMIDCPGNQDGSSLRSLIDKPPVCGNSFSPLTGALLTGFRLHTGPVLTLHNVHTNAFLHLLYYSPSSARASCSLCSAAAWTVQTDAHTASKEEKQTQAQAPSTAGPTASRCRAERPSWCGSAASFKLTSTDRLCVFTSQKRRQTLIPRRRRKSETMIRTARKRRKTRKRRKWVNLLSQIKK